MSRRYVPAALEAAGIYPSIWARDGREAFEYLSLHHRELVRFYRLAAGRGDAVVLHLG